MAREMQFRLWCLRLWALDGQEEFAGAAEVLLRRRGVVECRDAFFECSAAQWRLKLKVAAAHMGITELPELPRAPPPAPLTFLQSLMLQLPT